MRGSGFLGTLRHLIIDRRGVSAVEFALIAPIMILFYFAMAEFCQGFMAQKRMGHAAAMVGDLVSQSTGDITADQLNDIFAIGDLIVKPFSAQTLTLRVTSVTRDDKGVVKVDWSKGRGITAFSKGEQLNTIPDDLIGNGESLVISESGFKYDSPVNYLIADGIQFEQRHYMRPRALQKVTCTDC